MHNATTNASPSVYAAIGPRKVKIAPELQHVPVDPSLKHIRPPPPRVSDAKNASIFIGISSYRDGARCGRTIYSALKEAVNPVRVLFGIVEQYVDGEPACLESYCDYMAKDKEFLTRAQQLIQPKERGSSCPFQEQIRIRKVKSIDSRGPTLARHYQQKLIKSEEFCLQIDAHSMFQKHWDTLTIEDWAKADNEMAVVTGYVHDITAMHYPFFPYMCKVIRQSGLVRNDGAANLYNSPHPILQTFWGAGFSFSKCHAETRVPIDPYTPWVFDGEEYWKVSHLWTHGYDMYSSSVNTVFHDYTAVPKKFEAEKVSAEVKRREMELGINRLKLSAGIPFQGIVNTTDVDRYGYGNVRSYQAFLKYSGVDVRNIDQSQDRCRTQRWVPFENPTEIEKLVPGWSQSWSGLGTTDKVQGKEQTQEIADSTVNKIAEESPQKRVKQIEPLEGGGGLVEWLGSMPDDNVLLKERDRIQAIDDGTRGQQKLDENLKGRRHAPDEDGFGRDMLKGDSIRFVDDLDIHAHKGGERVVLPLYANKRSAGKTFWPVDTADSTMAFASLFILLAILSLVLFVARRSITSGAHPLGVGRIFRKKNVDDMV